MADDCGERMAGHWSMGVGIPLPTQETLFQGTVWPLGTSLALLGPLESSNQQPELRSLARFPRVKVLSQFSASP
jgi:hypothetical protein